MALRSSLLSRQQKPLLETSLLLRLLGHGMAVHSTLRHTCHAVGVVVHLWVIALHLKLMNHWAYALLRGNRAVLVRQKNCFKVDEFFPKLTDLRTQSIIFCAVNLDLLLQVR